MTRNEVLDNTHAVKLDNHLLPQNQINKTVEMANKGITTTVLVVLLLVPVLAAVTVYPVKMKQ